MTDPLISVIVPVYNAAPYLARCVDSIRKQTHANLEIILVDDGSRDGSLAVCRELAGLDARIHVIHQKNSGVSAARNAALSFAAGAYIAYLDADDYIAADYLQHLLENAVKYDADISCCDFVEVLNGQEVQISVPKVRAARLVPDMHSLFYDSVACQETYGTCVWAKLIRAELARKASFKPLKFGEDQVYMYDLFCTAPRVYLDTYKGYYYIRNEGSATVKAGNHSISRSMDELKMYQYKAENLPRDASDLYPHFYNLYAMGVHVYARAVVLSNDAQEMKKHREELRRMTEQVLKHSGYLTKRTKLYLNMYRYFPWLYRVLLLRMAKRDAIG